ncbi:hypothetical protein [Baekduia sp. Peel2402]|uniref:hypothetical protein n=1 Tax=Baekduia sp. Peel2402 TaxID=3458296 RepID=UPI00403E5A83
MGDTLSVTALLRAASADEVTEGLERNPGSARLVERGWEPLWFEARVFAGEDEQDHVFSLVWREPGRPAAEVADEELESALSSLDVWLDDVVSRVIDVTVD